MNHGPLPQRPISAPPAADAIAEQTSELRSGDAVVIATSPKAGSGAGRDCLQVLQEKLEAADLRVEVHGDVPTIRRRVDEAIARGRPPCVIAAGGDGTLNLMASLLPAEVPIMPLPLGTENLVARHYGVCNLPDAAAETVLRGRSLRIDAGIARFGDFDHPRRRSRERMFLVMASVGFDAQVVRRMHLTRRGHIRRISYAKPILATLRSYRYPPVRVERFGTEADGDPLTVAWALVFNLPRYAAGLAVETSADETDGLLDFCGLRDGSLLHGLRYLSGVISGRHATWPDVHRIRSERFRFSSEAPLAVQLDGDYVGRLPLDVRVAPQRVTLRLPNTPNPRAPR